MRQLEQQNDDLERAKRSTLASLEDFEVKMNATIERNAFLESELDEKESLKAAVQRLKDETRDLRQELRIVTAPAPSGHCTPKRAFSLESPSYIPGPSVPDNDKSRHQDSNKASSSLTPSARQSALNIVGDLLKKVGALELKLSSCRNIVKENSGNMAIGNHLSSAQSSSANNLSSLTSPAGHHRSTTSKPSSPK